MGLEALTAVLEREATATADAILARARAEATAIAHAVEAEAAAERDRQLATTEAAHAAAAATRLAVATRQARSRVLEAERTLLEAIRVDAEAALTVLPVERWRDGIPMLVGTALRYAGEGAVSLRCAAAVEDRVWAVAGAREAVSVNGIEGMVPGLVLTRDDGTLQVPLTLLDRLAALWPDLQLEIRARLEQVE